MRFSEKARFSSIGFMVLKRWYHKPQLDQKGEVLKTSCFDIDGFENRGFGNLGFFGGFSELFFVIISRGVKYVSM